VSNWAAFTVVEVVELLRGAPARWWLSGGCALDRFAGRVLRAHPDIDVSIAICDWDAFAAHVSGRVELWNARDGTLTPVAGQPWHNVWARTPGTAAWQLQVNLEPVVDGIWRYRRDQRVQRPLAEVVWRDGDVQYVNPAVQLLWKAKAPQPKDEIDFDAVLERLPVRERAWLTAAVALAHPASPWRARLG
jgi:hypothetical protein